MISSTIQKLKDSVPFLIFLVITIVGWIAIIGSIVAFIYVLDIFATKTLEVEIKYLMEQNQPTPTPGIIIPEDSRYNESALN